MFKVSVIVCYRKDGKNRFKSGILEMSSYAETDAKIEQWLGATVPANAAVITISHAIIWPK